METQNEILKGNKLIAEFMGVINESSNIYYMPEFGAYKNNYGQIEFEDCFRPNELKYHNSWAWIMPVWEKIVNIGDNIDSSIRKAYFTPIKHSLYVCDISGLFNDVTEFIKWYNLKNQTK